MGRRQSKNSSNNLKSNMKTPEPSKLTTGGLEHPNPEEAKEIDIMNLIESLKSEAKYSLKEMNKKNNKKFEEMNKFLNDTLGNQEKTIKQIMETV